MSSKRASSIKCVLSLRGKEEEYTISGKHSIMTLLCEFATFPCRIAYQENGIKYIIPTHMDLKLNCNNETATLEYLDKVILKQENFKEDSIFRINLEKIDSTIDLAGVIGVESFDHEKVEDLKQTFSIAFIVRDESLSPPLERTFFASISNWRQLLLSQNASKSRLFYVDPWSRMEIQVSFDIVCNGTTYKTRNFGMYFLFIVDEDESKKATNEESLTLNGVSVRVVPISTVSKFIIRSEFEGILRSEEGNPTDVDQDIIASSFKASFKNLKLDPVSYVIAHAYEYSKFYKNRGKFYASISCLFQGSGSGKSKTCTTATKRTPGFYVCFREENAKGLSFPPANSVSESFLEIFNKYSADTLENQRHVDWKRSNVGKCLLFVASCIKSYYVAIALKFASSLSKKPSNVSEHNWLLQKLDDFASFYFEGAVKRPDYFRFLWTTMADDVFRFATFRKNPGSVGTSPADGSTARDFSSASATVAEIGDYIQKIIESPFDCFTYDESILREPGLTANKIDAVKRACTLLENIIKGGAPFLFFIDEAGILAGKGGFAINDFPNQTVAGKFSAFQILRRALSYLPTAASIHFIAIGTKSSIEEFSPPIVDSSSRGNERTNSLPPIIFTQNFDIWREEYPLNELVPCFRQLSNCCLFKFLVTLGHPLSSSVNFQNLTTLLRDKLLNGTSKSTKTYLMAIWMIRAGLSCDPRSVLAGSLVEEHMATLFNVRSAHSASKGINSAPTFARESFAAYDITYPSNPCLNFAARRAIAGNTNTNADFFRILESKLDSVVADRGKLGEAIGCLATILAIDAVPNSTYPPSFTASSESTSSTTASANAPYMFSTLCNDDLIKQMKELTVEKFHSLWDRNQSLLGAGDREKHAWFDFSDFKTITVESFLKTLLNVEDFEKMRPSLPQVALGGLINASHFVTLSRIDSMAAQEPANANDLVFDKKRNIITRNRLRFAMARQCAIIMPPNSFAYDAIIPICLPIELVIGPDGRKSIKPINLTSSNGVPSNVYKSNPSKYQGQSQYRPIYSFLGIQFKTGRFDADALPIMDPRLHFVPCPVHGYNLTSIDECRHCEEELALKEILKNHISLLYCFKERSEVQKTTASSFSVFHGCRVNESPEESTQPIVNFFRAMYPHLDPQQAQNLAQNTPKLKQTMDIRTFEDYYMKHSQSISESVDLVNFVWDENFGVTYKKAEINAYVAKMKTYQEAMAKYTAKNDTYDRFVEASEKEMAELQVSESTRDTKKKRQRGELASSAAKMAKRLPPKPVKPEAPTIPHPIEFVDLAKLPKIAENTPMDPKEAAKRPNFLSEARMSTIVLYGWEKWIPFIKPEGAESAKRLLGEFNLNPIRNVDEYDLPILTPSLKVFMASKLVGVDQDESPEETVHTVDKWHPLVRHKMSRFQP